MSGVPSTLTIVGFVLAISMAIILLAGLALYISFRIRENLREEKGGGARVAKVAFLIGLLFLSGGVFYFFATGFNSTTGRASASLSTSQSSSTTGTLSSHSSQSSTTTTTASSTTSTTSTSSTTSSGGLSVSMNVQCPTSGGSVAAGSTFSCTVTIYNTGAATYSSATLVSSSSFTEFSFQSCSETINGSPATCTAVSSSQISVGDIEPGTTVLTVGVAAPTTAGQKSCALTLGAVELGQTITSTFTIQVTNKP
jgi:hypothetical protein